MYKWSILAANVAHKKNVRTDCTCAHGQVGASSGKCVPVSVFERAECSSVCVCWRDRRKLNVDNMQNIVCSGRRATDDKQINRLDSPQLFSYVRLDGMNSCRVTCFFIDVTNSYYRYLYLTYTIYCCYRFRAPGRKSSRGERACVRAVRPSLPLYHSGKWSQLHVALAGPALTWPAASPRV